MNHDPEAFWLVWNPNGNNPHYRHPTRELAAREAERLAEMNPGQDFYVLLAESVSRRMRPVETIELSHIPF